MTVRGRAISRTFCQPLTSFECATQNSRSDSVNRGFLPFLSRTINCWRRARFFNIKESLSLNPQTSDSENIFTQEIMPEQLTDRFRKINGINCDGFSGTTADSRDHSKKENPDRLAWSRSGQGIV